MKASVRLTFVIGMLLLIFTQLRKDSHAPSVQNAVNDQPRAISAEWNTNRDDVSARLLNNVVIPGPAPSEHNNELNSSSIWDYLDHVLEIRARVP